MDGESLRSLLSDNLIDQKEFQRDPSKVSCLECFHFNIPAQPNFKAFPGLTELRIIEQDVSNLKFLEDLPNLEKLIVFHTLLSDASGLHCCPRLRSIILEGNKLKTFPDISCAQSIEELSVAENPLEEIPVILEHNKLRELNLAACNLSCVPPTINCLKKLTKLNLSSNNIHSFKDINSLSSIKTLKELSFDDPNYGSNPICSMPGYEIAVGSMLPQVEIFDTFTISKRFRQVCDERKKEAKIFYSTMAVLDAKEYEQQRKDFYDQYNRCMSEVISTCNLNNDKLKKIEKICFEFEHNIRECRIPASELQLLSYKSLGVVRATKLLQGYQEWEEFNDSVLCKLEKGDERVITVAWEVSNAGAEEFAEKSENTTRNPKYVIFRSAKDAINAIKNWTEIDHKYSESIPLNKNAEVIVICNTVESSGMILSYPEYLFVLSVTNEQLIKEIEQLCHEMAKEGTQINEDSTPETLCVLQRSFTLADSLVDVTLIDCGISSLTELNGLSNMKTLNLMFNKIESIRDMPVFPALESLDLRFNLISDVSDLIPDNDAAKGSINEISILGNPIFTPTTQKLVSELFGKDKQRKILYSPPNNDALFISTLANPDTISYIDVSSNCLTTIKPLAALKNLKVVNASHNHLRHFDLTSQILNFADVSCNFITELPVQSTVPSLQFLNISNNEVKQLSSLNTLVALFASSNDIDTMPDTSFYPSLIVLSMENNPIMEEIDPNRLLYQYKTIKFLNGNPIKQSMHNKVQNSLSGILFPEELHTLLYPGQTALNLEDKAYKDVNILASDTVQSISLKNNYISDIKWKKTAFPKLIQIDLTANTLQNLDFLQHLQLLRSLNLSYNKIGDSLMKQFSSLRMPHLKQIIMTNNTIKTLSATTFPAECFPSLELLDLSHNYIMQIARNSFAEHKIISIDISYNSLKKLDGLNIPTLTHLDVSHNRITTVEEVEKLRPCTSLTHFCFNDNPLNQRTIPRIRCLCILRSLIEMDNKPVTESDLNQVQQILDQQSAGIIQLDTNTQPGRTNRVTNIIMSPNLPSLHDTSILGQVKRKNDRQRYPR